jgi:putative exporter of polyketide antibiotics
MSSFSVLFLYVIGYLGTLLDKDWIMYFSPFQLFNSNNALDLPNSSIVGLIVYLILGLIFILVGKYMYKKRDFEI